LAVDRTGTWHKVPGEKVLWTFARELFRVKLV